MRIKRLDGNAVLLVFDTGDRFPAELVELASTEGIRAARFTAIGAFERFTLAYWNRDSREYELTEYEEQVEVTSLTGNVGVTAEGETRVHAHVTIGRQDYSALAAHLMDATVRPTLELFLTVYPEETIVRREHEETKLMLIV
jgi:uncharacterized protein